MGITIRARFLKGVIEPLEKVELAEGQEITVIIMELPAPSNKVDGSGASAGGWKGTLDAETLIRNIYVDRLIMTRQKPEL